MELMNSEQPESLMNRVDQVGIIVKQKINDYISAFNSSTEGIEDLSRLSGVSARTLWRLIGGEPKKPYVSTVLSLYKVFTGEESQENLVQTLDPILRDYVTNRVDAWYVDEDQISQGPKGFSKDILNDSTFRQILILVQTRNVHMSEIKELFGLNGLKMLDSLVSYGLVDIKSDVVSPTSKVVEIELDATYKITCDLLADYYEPTNLKHAHFFLLGRLSEAAYDEIARIDKKAYEEKRKIFAEKSNVGEVPIWTISAVGTTEKTQKQRVLQ